MSNNYDIKWSILQNEKLLSIIKRKLPFLIQKIKNLSQPNKLPILDILGDFDNKKISRPNGSRRAFYIKNNDFKYILAVKGTEICSSELKNAMKLDYEKMIPNRPWTRFENFIYREQKAPLAMFFNEALSEAKIGAKYQLDTYKNFKILEEAPIPLIVFKWNKSVVDKYINTINPYLDNRAKELLLPLIEVYGLGGIVYYYPYLPTRIRFEKSIGNSSKKITTQKQFSAFENLIDIQARMFLNKYLPFSFEDHGIGQCIAPQNVTLKGGICDLGSIKEIEKFSSKNIYILLRATGGILTRTIFELFGSSIQETIYEFENPTTIQHHLSAIVHEKLKTSLNLQSNKYSIDLNNDVRTYYSSDNVSLKKSLGLTK